MKSVSKDDFPLLIPIPVVSKPADGPERHWKCRWEVSPQGRLLPVSSGAWSGPPPSAPWWLGRHLPPIRADWVALLLRGRRRGCQKYGLRHAASVYFEGGEYAKKPCLHSVFADGAHACLCPTQFLFQNASKCSHRCGAVRRRPIATSWCSSCDAVSTLPPGWPRHPSQCI